jgi:hypothetical protein
MISNTKENAEGCDSKQIWERGEMLGIVERRGITRFKVMSSRAKIWDNQEIVRYSLGNHLEVNKLNKQALFGATSPV